MENSEKVQPTNPRVVDWTKTQFKIENFIDLFDIIDNKARLWNFRMPSETQPPKGVVVYFHGFGSHSNKASHISEFYSKNGFDFVAFDQKGFGKSEGLRGIIDSKESAFENAMNFTVLVRKYYQDLYKDQSLLFFNMGYSLGCALSIGATNLLKQNGHPQFDGYLYLVPCIRALFDHWTPEQIQETEELSKSTPPQDVSFDPFQPLIDASWRMGIPKDPYASSWQNSQSILILKHILEGEEKCMNEFDQPIHITMAMQDNAVDNKDTQKFFDNIKTTSDKKQLLELDCEHSIVGDGYYWPKMAESQLEWIKSVFNI